MKTYSRRNFVVVIAGAGGGLLLGCRVGESRRAASISDAASTQGTTPPAFAPNAYVRVGTDDTITVMLPQAEMGQGIYTALPMLVAEELEVGLDRVRVEHAPGDDRIYANPLLGFQATGGSTSIRGFFEPMRQAGAVARTMLVAAAAQGWSVDPSTCRAEKGSVIHPGTGRRMTYGDLAEQAAKMPAPANVALKNAKTFRLIGTSAKRLDTPSKVNGSAQFGIDVRLPGMKIATIAASPVRGGKVSALDQDKAMAIKGVRQVVRLDDVVAVVADHMFAARQGLAALAIKWNDGPNGKLSTTDVVKDLEKASSAKDAVVARKEGNALSTIGPAARNIEAVYHQPFLAHAAMEPLSCTVHVREDSCEVWCGSQVQGRARATAAEVTGLPLEKVVMHNYFLGGGFGRRLEHDYVTQAVRIAKEVQGPVKIVWTREEDIQHDAYRPYYLDRMSAGLDRRGKLVRWTHRVVGPSILSRWAPPAFKNGLDGDAVDGAAQLLYDIPAIQIEYVRHEEPLYTGWWRGVGVTHNCFVVESFIDELAVASQQDPVAFRRGLLGKSPRARAVLDLAAKKAGWGKKLPPGQGRGVALMYSGWDTYLAQVADVEVSDAGEIGVRRVVCAVDCGTIINPDTVVAQMESGVVFGISGALWGEITLKNGRVEQSNFSNYRVLRMSETPPIEVHLVRNLEKPGGIGEPGTAATAPALANAVFAATGKRIRALPLQKPFQV